MEWNDKTELKKEVKAFWDAASCGEVYAEGDQPKEYYNTHENARYALEPYILTFAKFESGRSKDILEIGVGMGADHIRWARSGPKSLNGIDLTPRAVEHTRKRLAIYQLISDVREADSEQLPFPDNSFDIVYSWGVLHHTPHTADAVKEVHRVLRPGGTAKIMIYHTYSLTGYLLWLRFGLLSGKPGRSLADIYAEHLESPGTKAFTVDEAEEMFNMFSQKTVSTQLSFGDLLQGEVGQRYKGRTLQLIKALWPRWFWRIFFRRHGLCLLIDAQK